VTNTLSYCNTDLIAVVICLFVHALTVKVKKAGLGAYLTLSSELQPYLKKLVKDGSDRLKRTHYLITIWI
jgi:hypothetical protein